jgi:PfaD family protein
MEEPLMDLAAALAGQTGARHVRISTDGGAADAAGPGGGLAGALERGGVEGLLGQLPDGAELRMEDNDGVVSLKRDGASGALRVRWADGPAWERSVRLRGGWARPQPAAARALSPALSPAGAPAAALDDVERELMVHGGRLFDGAGPVPGAGRIPAARLSDLGSPAFLEAFGVRAACVAGAMAGGIASVELVVAMARGGLLGEYGAGGLSLAQVEADLQRLQAAAPEGAAWGANLLHNPVEPEVESRTVDLFLASGVKIASASAFMTLTPAVVRYRFSGISVGPDGVPRSPQRLIAKVSRPEVAERFLRPPPEALLRELVAAGALRADEARMAADLPVAEHVTGEADSGGHTDHRPLVVLIPLLLGLRDRVQAEQAYARFGVHLGVGAAGGIGDPRGVLAAFTLGADYIVTGSINQATREAGTSDRVKALLAEAGMADVASAPAPDMFELGAQVQVLSKGSMYPARARKLHELYRAYGGIAELPADEREKLERTVFRRSLDEVWAETRAFWAGRDPREVTRAEADPRHQMALTFRWYLGMSSRWARVGDPDRVRDYQVWCGPAIGAFNAWAAGGPFEAAAGRGVVEINEALMRGALALRRRQLAALLGHRGA